MVDASSPDRIEEMKVAYETLDMLGIVNKKVLTLFNKIDKLENEDDKLGLIDKRAVKSIQISAKQELNLEEVTAAIDEILREDRQLIEKIFTYSEMSEIADLKKYGEVLEEEYLEEGIRIKAYI